MSDDDGLARLLSCEGLSFCAGDDHEVRCPAFYAVAVRTWHEAETAELRRRLAAYEELVTRRYPIEKEQL